MKTPGVSFNAQHDQQLVDLTKLDLVPKRQHLLHRAGKKAEDRRPPAAHSCKHRSEAEPRDDDGAGDLTDGPHPTRDRERQPSQRDGEDRSNRRIGEPQMLRRVRGERVNRPAHQDRTATVPINIEVDQSLAGG
jgi:hypothetical protein